MYGEVVRALRERGAHFEVLHHGAAASGTQEAVVLGMHADDVLKAVVLKTCDGAAVAVLPANRRLDMDLVRVATGDRTARLATEAEIEGALPDCELGAVPPLGSILHAPAYVDPEVLGHPVVAFAAGTQTESVRGPAVELFSGETVTVMPITEPAGGRLREDG
ncbi:MAG TPA: YbaK/EbsC family protein [Candidatus Dormibacteraeota bacterium]|nr:YbaK/EbsC family protein [Candidatus Dormibacteraeota bacterium]